MSPFKVCCAPAVFFHSNAQAGLHEDFMGARAGDRVDVEIDLFGSYSNHPYIRIG